MPRLSRGRGALQRLESFEPSAAHGAVGSDLDRFAYVAYLCEITDELVFERQVETELFAALCGALGAVIEGPPQALTLRQYELALLRCLGLLPARHLRHHRSVVILDHGCGGTDGPGRPGGPRADCLVKAPGCQLETPLPAWSEADRAAVALPWPRPRGNAPG